MYYLTAELVLQISAAEHLVERDQTGEAGKACSDQVLLSAVEGALGVEDDQIAVNPLSRSVPGRGDNSRRWQQ